MHYIKTGFLHITPKTGFYTLHKKQFFPHGTKKASTPFRAKAFFIHFNYPVTKLSSKKNGFMPPQKQYRYGMKLKHSLKF